MVRESLGERWLVTTSKYKAGWPIRKLFTERVAPHPGVADMLVEINDEQRRRLVPELFRQIVARAESVRSRYHL